MINRMSIEKLATNILKRAVAAEHISDADARDYNERNLREDFEELAQRLGYKVEKI